MFDRWFKWRTTLKSRWVARLAMIGALAIVPAYADVVYTNFGAGMSFNDNSGYLIGACCSVNEVNATSFMTSSSVQFTDAILALNNLDLSGFGTPGTQVTVTLDTDSGSGTPGVVLDTLTQETNVSAPGAVTFACATCPVLAANTTYWLVMSSPDGSVTTWDFSNSDSTTFEYNLGGSTSGPWTSTGTTTRGAFEVDGSAVPETGSFWFLTPLLAGVTLAMRRRLPARA